MLGHVSRYIILTFFFFISLAGGAQTLVDSLRSRLAAAADVRDSIMLLYNIYDCSPRQLQGAALEDLYRVALSHADYPTVNDVLKLSSICYVADDSMQKVLKSRAEMLPESPQKRATLVYMNVMAAENLVRSMSEAQREATLRDYIARHPKSEELDTYSRIEYLLQLCTYLRRTTDGELLTNYLRELQPLIDTLPDSDLPLKSLFYRQAADSYLSNSMIPEAVGANKTLLGIISKFENRYAATGRTFRSYDNAAFICYTRLLRCHDELTPEEVDDCYARINSLIDRDPSLASQAKKPALYYMMARKRYAEAIPAIKEQLADTLNTPDEQLYLVDALLTAAEAVGSNDDLLMALDMSNDILKRNIEDKAAESYKDLQIVYEVNDLREANDELMLTNQQIVIKRHKDRLTYSVIGIVVLLVLLAVMFVLYRRSKRLTSNLAGANAMIMEERDALQRTQKDLISARDKADVASRVKTDFINNMSHEIRNPLEAIVEYSGLIADCADKDRREYIRKFADVISLNTDLLLTLVNEVLELPSLESSKLSVHITKSSLQEICRHAIGKVSRHIRPGIDLIFANDNQDDTIVMTDPHRVEQVLLNLLMNSARFTAAGSVTLAYTISPDRDKVTFTVTDTGVGIPQGREEVIFSRFEKLNSTTQGKGLGLYISRLLADMLGGSLTLDTDYDAGAKFIFTIPIS